MQKDILDEYAGKTVTLYSFGERLTLYLVSIVSVYLLFDFLKALYPEWLSAFK
jgi:hypothetical protein